MVNQYCYAQNFVEVNSADKIHITPKVKIATSSQRDFGENLSFDSLDEDSIRLGYSNKTLFIKFSLKNTTFQKMDRVLYLDHLLTGFVDLKSSGKIIKSGSSRSLTKRPFDSVYTAFPITLNAFETKEFTLRKYGQHVLNTKIFLVTKKEFKEINNEKLNVFKFYTGAIFALFIYNLFIAFLTRNKTYFVYCGYLIALYMAVVGSQGVVDRLDIFPNTTLSHYLIIFSSSSLIFSFYFARSFLETDTFFPRFKYICHGFSFLALIPIIYALLPWYDRGAWLFGNYIDFLIPVSILIYLAIGIYGVMNKKIQAYIYLLSWSFLFIGAFLYLASVHGLLPRTYIYNNGLLFGNVFEMLILSLGLGYQLIILKNEKEEALEKLKVKEKLQRLVRVLSHDIGNSLQISILYLRKLQKAELEPKLEQSVDKIMMATKNIHSILNHVREEQKLDDAKEYLKLDSISFNECLDKSINLFNEKIKEKQLYLENNLEQNLSIYAEKTTLINHVLGNILSNVIKFSKNQGVIKINPIFDQSKIIIEISDSGEGFPEEILNSLQVDGQIDSTLGTYGEKGSGFGLKIIKNYMSLYGGDLDIYNDQGAVYKLSFNLS